MDIIVKNEIFCFNFQINHFLIFIIQIFTTLMDKIPAIKNLKTKFPILLRIFKTLCMNETNAHCHLVLNHGWEDIVTKCIGFETYFKLKNHCSLENKIEEKLSQKMRINLMLVYITPCKIAKKS